MSLTLVLCVPHYWDPSAKPKWGDRGSCIILLWELNIKHIRAFCLSQSWEQIQGEIKGRLLQPCSSNLSSVNRHQARIVLVFTPLFEFSVHLYSPVHMFTVVLVYAYIHTVWCLLSSMSSWNHELITVAVDHCQCSADHLEFICPPQLYTFHPRPAASSLISTQVNVVYLAVAVSPWPCY